MSTTNLETNGTKVWVKNTAIEAIRNPRLSFKEKATRKNSPSNFGHFSLSSSSSSSSIQGSVSRQGSFASRHSRQGSFGTSDVGSICSIPTVPICDTDSDVGSVGFGVPSQERKEQWEWKTGWITESSRTKTIVKLDEIVFDGPAEPVTFPASAIKDGDILMANEYQQSKEGSPIYPNDLISLPHLHEPAVVDCLQHRYNDNIIYTSTGPVLLALNPFQTVRGLYGENTMKKYWEKAEKGTKDSLPPHVYAIADKSFRTMMRKLDESLGEAESTGCDQSILVSGESGSGKTVTTKFVMKYLAALSQRAGNQAPPKRAYIKVAEQKEQAKSQPNWMGSGYGSRNTLASSSSVQESNQRDGLSNVTSLSGSTSTNSIEAQVLQSNPILESFGNARTMRNDNSSRFGKFIEIQFTRTGRLVGAQIDTYLLEKVRLVTQARGERNYHIFFELLSGAMDSSELRKYFIASTATPDDFRITANGIYDRRDGVSDQETFRALRTAMNTMKFGKTEQQDVFSIAAAILHASNLNFKDLDQESALDERNIHLEPLCYLLGISSADLNEALCYFYITAGRDTHLRRSLTIEKAEKGLEAVLKSLYGALFTFLVERINDSIAYMDPELEEGDVDGDVQVARHGSPVACIGVLDIFGFESFAINSFEQLCINYCNEALQQQFNAFVLRNEQAEYEREGIEWSFIEFPENQDVLDLIEKRGTGILSILDDQCKAPGTSDKSFALGIYSKCKGQNRFSLSRKQMASHQFSIHHYAGPVEYTATGFVEKNRDELPKESTDLLLNSVNPFVQLLAGIIDHQQNPPPGPSIESPYKLRRQDSSVVSRITVGGQFRKQLKHLRDKIDKMSPHYIRCLKPNDMLIPDYFEAAAVAEQLRCGGILEAVRVARAGFSNHYPHDTFLKRYRALAWKELKQQKDFGGRDTSHHGGRSGLAGYSPGRLNFNGPSSYNKQSFHSPSKPSRNNISSPSPPRSGSNSSKWEKPSPIGYRNGNNSFCANSPSSQPQTPSDNNKTEEDVTTQCKELIKVLYKKLQGIEKYEIEEDEGNQKQPPQSPQPVRGKSYTYASSTPPPSWSKSKSAATGFPPTPLTAPVKGRMAPWEKKQNDLRAATAAAAQGSSPPQSLRGGVSGRRGSSVSDWAKLGIQFGKSKVFLRRKAFEALERLRSEVQGAAALKLNSIFRMYLARVAYIEVRDAVRLDLHEHRKYFDNEFKETKEQEYDEDRRCQFHKVRDSFTADTPSLIDIWASSVRASIHNPVPRNQWGTQTPTKSFKWKLVDGLWIKNHEF